MKKVSRIIGVGMCLILAASCRNSQKVTLESNQDSVVTQPSAIDTNKADAVSTDTPALGTDNIRMDSMNNSKQ
jgi:hypothetical protein